MIAQVGEQQKTLRLVPIEYLRAADARLLQEIGNFDKRCTVFFVRWCIHHDHTGPVSTVAAVQAQITPETGIDRRQAQALGLQAEALLDRLQPDSKRMPPHGIGPVHCLQHSGCDAIRAWG